MGILITLLVIWLVLAILGAVIEGLFWLLAIAAVLFVATLVWGLITRKNGRRRGV